MIRSLLDRGFLPINPCLTCISFAIKTCYNFFSLYMLVISNDIELYVLRIFEMNQLNKAFMRQGSLRKV